ncbi:TRL-like family protein [Archangium violaceum]|uniref:TRL-like family protein n=1 Tax=Archangium violaceum TaxID=83451 RepID=UPI00195182C8|nr:TRL-like family protein [Archangium violaceum]QRN94787.1 TRL-like family protein [Archangium violaceum]
MNLLRKLSVVAVLSLGLSGCAGVAFIGTGAPGSSGLYAQTTSNSFINEQTKLGSKSGESCITSILGLVTTGDAGVNETAKKAGISRVTHIDQKLTNIIGVYATYCVVVYGD